MSQYCMFLPFWGHPVSAFLFCSFIHQWLYSPSLGLGRCFSFVIFFTQTVGLLGRGISPLEGLCLHTGQHKHRISPYADIHASTGIRTHYLSVRAGEDFYALNLVATVVDISLLYVDENKQLTLFVGTEQCH
jgi:hypothetical protein